MLSHAESFYLVLNKPLIYPMIPCHRQSHRDTVPSVHLFRDGRILGLIGCQLFIATIGLHALPPWDVVAEAQFTTSNDPDWANLFKKLPFWMSLELVFGPVWVTLPPLGWCFPPFATSLEDKFPLPHFMDTPSPIKSLTRVMICQFFQWECCWFF